jgi:hypothetical protein
MPLSRLGLTSSEGVHEPGMNPAHRECFLGRTSAKPSQFTVEGLKFTHRQSSERNGKHQAAEGKIQRKKHTKSLHGSLASHPILG